MKIDSKKLGLAMVRAGCAFKELAEAAGVSRATLSYINCGKSCRPATLGRIAKALGVDPTEIIAQEG